MRNINGRAIKERLMGQSSINLHRRHSISVTVMFTVSLKRNQVFLLSMRVRSRRPFVPGHWNALTSRTTSRSVRRIKRPLRFIDQEIIAPDIGAMPGREVETKSSACLESKAQEKCPFQLTGINVAPGIPWQPNKFKTRGIRELVRTSSNFTRFSIPLNEGRNKYQVLENWMFF